jgi:hypothetical protein
MRDSTNECCVSVCARLPVLTYTHTYMQAGVLLVCVCAPACVDIHIYIHTGRGVASVPSWLWHAVR